MAETVRQSAPVILAVNPGSTSAKVALYAGRELVAGYEISRAYTGGLRGAALDAEVDAYVADLRQFLKTTGRRLDAVVGRGGFICRDGGHLDGGVYLVAEAAGGTVRVCDEIVTGVRDHCELDHASNLGIPIAARLAVEFGVPAFTVDPVVSDDFTPEARLSGYAVVERRSTAHALSVKRLAAKVAEETGRPLAELRMVVTHMGGGVTVAAVREDEFTAAHDHQHR